MANNVSGSVELFARMLSAMVVVDGEKEPRMNVIASYIPSEGYVVMLLPRKEHRPACYSANGDSQRIVSPGTLDMAGLVITPRESDFRALTAEEAVSILREVALEPDEVLHIVEKSGCGYENC